LNGDEADAKIAGFADRRSDVLKLGAFAALLRKVAGVLLMRHAFVAGITEARIEAVASGVYLKFYLTAATHCINPQSQTRNLAKNCRKSVEAASARSAEKGFDSRWRYPRYRVAASAK
jgi:hypothetical protein